MEGAENATRVSRYLGRRKQSVLHRLVVQQIESGVDEMKIAVVGSGIAGLSCAYRLAQANHDVMLFEANDYFGGHTHTVDVTLDGMTHGVDTGFLVFNHRTYPQLVQLFDELEVETVATDMSFSVKLPLGERMLEWAGANLDTVFAQRRNLFNPRFIAMLRDILRFNRQASALALAPSAELGAGFGFARRISGAPSLQRGISRLVSAADGGLHLVLSDRTDARLPAVDLRPVLPQPRFAAGQRPAAVAYRQGRRAYLRQAAAAGNSRPATGDPG